jgi:hypothetical protein
MSKTIETIVVSELEGYGYSILYTADGEAWICAERHGPKFNEWEKDQCLALLRKHSPAAQVIEQSDFDGRVPKNLCTPKTRVI